MFNLRGAINSYVCMAMLTSLSLPAMASGDSKRSVPCPAEEISLASTTDAGCGIPVKATEHDEVPVATREYEFDLNKHLTPLMLSKDALQRGISLSSTARIYESGDNKYRMTRGCVFINTVTGMQVETAVATVYAKPETSFIVHADANVTRVMNLNDHTRHGVQVVIDKRLINLNPGEEIGIVKRTLRNGQVAASGPSVGYRSMRAIPVGDDYRVIVFEFSIPDALKHCVIFQQLRESNDPVDHALLTDIVKTAAAVDTMFKKTREPYKHYGEDGKGKTKVAKSKGRAA